MAKTPEPFLESRWVPGQFSAPIGPVDLPRCSHCQRRMRPQKAKKVDWPGTVATGANSLCSSHYIASRRGSLDNPLNTHDWAFQHVPGVLRVDRNTPEERAAARRVTPEDLWDMLDIREVVVE